ncbi:hypothetical protein MLD38_037807 [Melastoma candidum]|uniref:Uncharacterized protein n=1 Tax=Melastoma candidum TaxID=119954 RepID=A0ACB9LPR2_9MYRT|nr:hypothetical protein MLD38_037807 [Melastoma candidum]
MGVYIALLSLLPVFFFFLRQFLIPAKLKNLPPGPAGLPFLGSLHKLGNRAHQSLYGMARRYGPIMTVRLGSALAIVVSTPDAAQEILRVNDRNFTDRFIPDVVTAQPSPEYTVAWSDGDSKWRIRRRLCNTQMFSTISLDKFQHLRHQKVRQLVDHIRVKYSPVRKPVDISKVAFATALNLISSTVASVDVVDPEFETAQEFKEVVWRIMEDTGKPNLSDYFPVIGRFDLQGIKKHIKVSYTRLHKMFDEVIEKRLQERAESRFNRDAIKKGDFLDALLDQCEEKNSGLDRYNIKPLILDIFIGGTDTTAIAVEWTMAELVRNPSKLQKTREEIIKVIGAGTPVQESDIDRLPYLHAAVKESMRLHPPVPLLLPYKSKADIEVKGGYVIPEGVQLLINAWAIGRDPDYWNDPTSFIPERFLESRVEYKGVNFDRSSGNSQRG